ncbi:hypothetical protein [Mycolicibacterium komossense]|uniref:Uncharacterized protein n=1 Tax=Mycolicibacterium komossense TaxID=1779 RepID=A0ABT3CJE8_9MYCO|nr:hypothetical protein [Mycolicibacterium komossense]MCV7229567.1 hypothetical protein [Mycolicibacterium komossense]
MIVGLVFLSLIGWGYWLMFRDARETSVTTPPTAAGRSGASATTALGLEDDPDRWRVTRGAWTALDECQLIRLLTDSALRHPPAPNVIDTSVPKTEHEDTP